LNAPVAVAVDGAGYIWIANTNNSITLLDAAGNALSPTTGFTGGGMSTPASISIDAAGNVWVANSTGSGNNGSLTEILGGADPVVTPTSTAVKTSTLGVKP